MYTSTTQQNVMSLRGLSTDTKPVDQMWLENGSVFLEMDTCKVFVYDGENKVWIEQTDGGEGGDIVIDNDLSSTSENPVQNKVITNALEYKADLVGGKVPENQLPSYVDDVLEYASESAFPAEGETGKIYVALDTNITYRWSGSAYVQVGPEGEIVIANPTLAGTEADLTGLQVGSTKYKVGGGKKYHHYITIRSIQTGNWGFFFFSFIIINDNSEKFDTYVKIAKWLYDNNFRTPSSISTSYPVSNAYSSYQYKLSNMEVIVGLYSPDGIELDGTSFTNMNNTDSSVRVTNTSVSQNYLQIQDIVNEI